MSGPNRKREVQVNFRVSPQELEMIEQKMAQLGTSFSFCPYPCDLCSLA